MTEVTILYDFLMALVAGTVGGLIAVVIAIAVFKF